MGILFKQTWQFIEATKISPLRYLGQVYVFALICYLCYYFGSHARSQDYELIEIANKSLLIILGDIFFRLIFYTRFTINLLPFTLLIKKKDIAIYVLVMSVLKMPGIVLVSLAFGFFSDESIGSLTIAIVFAIFFTISNTLITFMIKELRLNFASFFLIVLYGCLLLGMAISIRVGNKFWALGFLALNLSYLVLLLYSTFIRLKNSIGDNLLENGKSKFAAYQFDKITKFIDCLLILRNRRVREQVALNFIFAFAIFIPQLSKLNHHQNEPELTLFFSLLVTGFFLISLWQFFLAWDSSYISLIFTAFNFGNLIKERYMFMIYATSIFTFLTIILMIFVSVDSIKFILTGYLLNIGFMANFLLLSSMFNDKGIELGKSVFFNYQGTKPIQILVFFSVIGLIILLFKSFLIFWDLNISLVLISLLPIIAFIFYFKILTFISKQILKRKYHLYSKYMVND